MHSIESKFEGLTDAQYRQLVDATARITVLIAGADDRIDKDEIAWAEKVTKIRSYSGPEVLFDYYKDVGSDFSERLQHFIDTLPQDAANRNAVLSDTLSELNPILACLEPKLGALLYDNFVSFAKHVAKSSGGFLRFFSISADEKKWVGLPMLTPIVYEEPEDEGSEDSE